MGLVDDTDRLVALILRSSYYDLNIRFLQEKYVDCTDLYSAIAAHLLNKPLEEVTPDERSAVKRGRHIANYGGI